MFTEVPCLFGMWSGYTCPLWVNILIVLGIAVFLYVGRKYIISAMRAEEAMQDKYRQRDVNHRMLERYLEWFHM